MNTVIVLIYSRYFCLHVCTSIYDKDLIFLLALLVSIPLFSKKKNYILLFIYQLRFCKRKDHMSSRVGYIKAYECVYI